MEVDTNWSVEMSGGRTKGPQSPSADAILDSSTHFELVLDADDAEQEGRAIVARIEGRPVLY